MVLPNTIPPSGTPLNRRPADNNHATAFLNIHIGGVGTTAGHHILERYRGDGEPFAMGAFHIDTDPATSLGIEDRLLIQLTAADVRAMRANPESFGSVATAIIRRLGRLLAGGDILNGSRTTRPLTQLALIYFEDRLCRALQKALSRLRERHKTRFVTPVIISSSGGGCGSAAQILLMDLLRRPAFRHRLLGGIPSDLLLPPMAFVVEPFAFVGGTSQMQSRKIIANSFAYRVESEHMLQQQAASYITHIGYANDTGTVLADPDLMAKVLGYSIYEIERCWPAIKARWVDGPDDVASITNYGGQDSPEFDLLDGSRLQVRRKLP
jgi:hypothetical protein